MIFLLQSSLLCGHILYILVYHYTFVLTLTFIFVRLILSVDKKLNDFNLRFFQLFQDFRHFFGLQLLSFNIRQYCDFFWIAFFEIFTGNFLLQFSSDPGIVFKQFFALFAQFYSVAYFFSMINFNL